MSNHISVFEPFSAPAEHENQLTRALLIVLRTIPVAHAAWLDLADRSYRANNLAAVPPGGRGIPGLHEFRSAEYVTQRWRLPVGQDPPQRIVSVVVTPEPRFEQCRVVTRGRRQGAPDLFVLYGSKLALQVEAKRFPNSVDEGQLDIHDDNAPNDVAVDSALVALTWEELFAAWWSLRKRGSMSAGEQAIFDDFLGYIDRHHRALRPYRTVEMCGDDVDLLARRCLTLLEDLNAGDVRSDLYFNGWNLRLDGTVAERAVLEALDEDGVRIRLRLFPADRKDQANLLYGRDLRRLLSLQEDGWQVLPHLHFARERAYRWGTFWWIGVKTFDARPPIEAYLEVFTQRELRETRKREKWTDWFDRVAATGLLAEEQRADFDRAFSALLPGERFIPLPGIELIKDWKWGEAARLDAEDMLGRVVLDEVNMALAALGQAPVVAD